METINKEEQLKRIANALEDIAQELGSVNVHLEDLNVLNDLSKCILYVPPMLHQNEGHYLLRIGGLVTTE